MREYRERPEDFTRQIIAEGSLKNIRVLEGKILKSVSARLNEDFYNKHENDGLFFDGWQKDQFTEEHKKNMSIAASNRKRTKEHLMKLHKGRRNSKNSEEHNHRISEKNSGRKHTEESLRKMSQKLKGRVSPNKNKKLGPQSEEQRRNTSLAIKKWWADKKASQKITGD